MSPNGVTRAIACCVSRAFSPVSLRRSVACGAGSGYNVERAGAFCHVARRIFCISSGVIMQGDYCSSIAAKRALAVVCACAALGASGWSCAAGPAAVEQRKPASAHAMVMDIEAILNRWEPVAAAAGARSPAWREMFRTQLGQLPEFWRNEVAHVRADAGNARASYAAFTQAFVNARFNMVGDAFVGKTTRKLGTATTDQVFLPIAPCRIVDTRNGIGPISAGTSRNFLIYQTTNAVSWSTQGGVGGAAVTSCPGTVMASGGGTLGTVTPSAVLATVTVVNASAAGNFLIWSGVGAPPTSSALNWTAAGEVLANTTVIPVGPRSGGALDFGVFYNGPTGFADVVVDVVGYFVENAATALQCATTTATGSAGDAVADGAEYTVNAPACPTGYTQTGTGCSYSNVSGVFMIEHSVEGAFNDCKWRNASGSALSGANFRADARCCRVPGQ
jgi:hypothetical protein